MEIIIFAQIVIVNRFLAEESVNVPGNSQTIGVSRQTQSQLVEICMLSDFCKGTIIPFKVFIISKYWTLLSPFAGEKCMIENECKAHFFCHLPIQQKNS